jgi:tetratricopeptide (TPR) repeat protein
MAQNCLKIVPGYIFRLLIIMSFIMNASPLSSQSKSIRQSSLDEFNSGNYEQAYKGFGELLQTYPKDPQYRYYSGVCLIKLNRNPEEALQLLQQARMGSAMVRALPPDILFWIGRAQQMCGKFSEAIDTYNDYTTQYGKKSARELGIPGYIQQCQDRKGMPEPPESKPENKTGDTQEKKPDTGVLKAVKPDQPADTRKGNDSLPADFDKTLSEAIDFQYSADSMTRIAEAMKGDLENLDFKGKTETRTKIAEAEKLAAEYQKEADKKYDEAQASMNSSSFSSVDLTKSDSLPEKEQVPDIIVPAETDKQRLPEVQKKDSVIIKHVESYSVFEIKKIEKLKDVRIEVNPSVPPGLIYRIQVAVFRNPISLSYFKGITPVYGFKAAGTEITSYYAGMFRKIADARKALVSVKQTGFKDAFITAHSDGRQISIERAAVLEKEWGKKAFFSAAPQKPAPADTIPPELYFRVEVLRSEKPIKQEVVDELRKIADTRGLDLVNPQKGLTICLIGKFITYESAYDYAGLLVRNGYRDARVVARLGDQEIPLETARKLFEKVN